MRAAFKLLMIASFAAAGAGCHKQQAQQQEQNVAMDNGAAATPSDVEALPPDESSGTPSDELANGSDNADVNDLNASANAD